MSLQYLLLITYIFKLHLWENKTKNISFHLVLKSVSFLSFFFHMMFFAAYYLCYYACLALFSAAITLASRESCWLWTTRIPTSGSQKTIEQRSCQVVLVQLSEGRLRISSNQSAVTKPLAEEVPNLAGLFFLPKAKPIPRSSHLLLFSPCSI